MDSKSLASFRIKHFGSATHCFKNFLNETKLAFIKRDSPRLHTKNHMFQFHVFLDFKFLGLPSDVFLCVASKSAYNTTIDAIIKISVINLMDLKCITKEFKVKFDEKNSTIFVNFITKDELEKNKFLMDNNLNVYLEIYEVEEITDSENNMKKNFETLLETGNFSDVIFVVEGNELPAHKAVICARSPVFARMFSSECKESKENRVVIHDISKKVFEKLLQFIYTNQVTKIGKCATELLMAADKYQIDDLKLKCIKYFINKTTDKNAIEQLILADRVSSKHFKFHCIEFICSKSDFVIKTEGWQLMKNDAKTYAPLMAELVEALAKYIRDEE